MSKVIRASFDVTPECDIEYFLATNLQIMEVHGGTLFTTTVTGAGYGSSPNDMAKIILFAATGGITKPTEEELRMVAGVIVDIQSRRHNGAIDGQCSTNVVHKSTYK